MLNKLQIVGLPQGYAVHGIASPAPGYTVHAWCKSTGEVVHACALDSLGREIEIKPDSEYWINVLAPQCAALRHAKRARLS